MIQTLPPPTPGGVPAIASGEARRRIVRIAVASCTVGAAIGVLLAAVGLAEGSVVLLGLAVIACLLVAVTLAILVTRLVHDASTDVARLAALVTVDPLTATLNRRGFRRALFGAITAAADRAATIPGVALLSIDIDHFKQINDRFGHPAGDAVLREIAGLLSNACRPGDSVARVGGEEFALVLPGADCETAGAVAERVANLIRTHQFGVLPVGFHVTVSIGISVEGITSEQDVRALRARADEALYAAKRSGRDRVLLWAPGVRSLATPRVALI